jgi:energy-coupling factor transport system permease protein
MAMIWVLWVILYHGEGPVILAFWLIDVTPFDVAQGGTVALRVGALTFTVMLWLFTTDQATLVRSLVSMGLPYEWGLTLAMALRYLPTMASVFRMISDAQQARALNLARGGPFRRARAHLPIIVAMLISALHTAENLSRALESRALGTSRRRTYLRSLHFRAADLAWTVVILSATALVAWARFTLHFGAHPLRLIP